MKIKKIEHTEPNIFCSTWQSLYKMPKKYFEKFNCVIVDECHTAKAKSLVSIVSKMCDTKYRFGFTGTLDGIEVNKLVLEGLFGPSYKIINTDELMQKGHLAKLDIKILLLKHPPNRFDIFEDEVQYIINHQKRNNFIKNLALDLKGNTLVLFSRVETHGQPLYELINNSKVDDRHVFFVHGGVETEEREKVREITEKENNAIIVASYGTFSTGVNIRNLHNVIFASPSKSRIRNLQSIGRVLRKSENKVKATLYDIADDISYKSRKNYTLNHLIERIKIYNEENFNYDIVNIPLK
jgi:superfamily II DNA or RNA helicase